MHIVYVIVPGGGPETYVKTLAPGLTARGQSVSVIYTALPARVKSSFDSSICVGFVPPTVAHYYLAAIVGNWHALPRRMRAWETANP